MSASTASILARLKNKAKMKDFYDIYYLATSFEFEGRKLQEAIYETFSKRGTIYERDTVQVIERLVKNEAIIHRWGIFCKKVLKYELDFGEVVRLVVAFIDPPFQAIVQEEELFGNWNSDRQRYA